MRERLSLAIACMRASTVRGFLLFLSVVNDINTSRFRVKTAEHIVFAQSVICMDMPSSKKAYAKLKPFFPKVKRRAKAVLITTSKELSKGYIYVLGHELKCIYVI